MPAPHLAENAFCINHANETSDIGIAFCRTIRT
jgi:hypothetical protein